MDNPNKESIMGMPLTLQQLTQMEHIIIPELVVWYGKAHAST